MELAFRQQANSTLGCNVIGNSVTVMAAGVAIVPDRAFTAKLQLSYL